MDRMTFWISLGPVFVVNAYFLASMAIFPWFYPKQPRVDFIDERHHSKILGKWVRYWWIWITTPLFKILMKMKLTPNHVSMIGTVFGFFSAFCFAFASRWVGVGAFGLGGWLMVLGASFDFMDGRIARLTGQESLAGAFFDSVMDRVSECAVFAGIAWYFNGSWILWLVMAALSGSMLTSYSKCRGDKMGVSYDGGTMQRPERIVYTGVGAILTPFFGFLLNKYFPASFPNIKAACDLVYALPLAFVALMSNVTTFNRIVNIMRLLDQKESRKGK